ncbi:MAG: extracellular solute-binding protein [Lachnospiraceae bacterium]|nr:extracellular solute-binding protein [Lachnospiraceae bacterium]
MRFKRAMALLLTAGLIAAGCGSQTAESQTTGAQTDATAAEQPAENVAEEAADSQEVVTLKVFSMPSNTSGVVEGWWADILREEVGVELEILPSGNEGVQKLQALMASGELPDIVVFNDNKLVENAVAGKMLLAYDDYKDLLPNLYENAENSLNYYADNVSDGQGKAYSVGTRILNNLPTKGSMNWGPYLRYDLYKQIGSPEIKTSEDYLDVLKQMHEIYSENEDGQKVYAFSLWSDWDGNRMSLADLLGNINGTSYDLCGYFQELDLETNEITSIFDENSWYQKTLRLYYDANQLGLLDPDSMTQRFDDATGKAGAGRTLFSWWGWATGGFDTAERRAQGIGFMPVEAEDIKILHQGLQPIGKNWSISVSSATEYPEKAMEFINYFFSEDADMILHNGPQGIVWDLDENGKPYVTKEGYDYILDGTKELPGGGSLTYARNTMNVLAFEDAEISDTYGVPFEYSYWDKPDYAPEDDALTKQWQEDYGAVDQIDYLTQHDGIAVAPFAPVAPIPDDLEQISSRVGEVVRTYSWKMVMAKDDAEYEQLRQEMTEKAIGMEVEKVNEWYKEQYQEAYEFGQKYS